MNGNFLLRDALRRSLDAIHRGALISMPHSDTLVQSIVADGEAALEATKARPLVLGQEVKCPDGLGRVALIGKDFIEVETYVNNRSCHWAPHNVTPWPEV